MPLDFDQVWEDAVWGDVVKLGRFMWWAPWGLTEPFAYARGTGGDEDGNLCRFVQLPLLGRFHWFTGLPSDD